LSLAGSMLSPMVAGHFLELRGGEGVLLSVSALLAFLAALLGVTFGSYPSFYDQPRAAAV
jgi:hypothetical protein